MKCYRRGRHVNTAMNTITNCQPPNKQIRPAVQKLPTIPIISMASWHCVGGCTGEGSWPNCLITSMVMIGREPPHYVARCWCMAHNGTCITSEQKRYNSRHLMANTRPCVDTCYCLQRALTLSVPGHQCWVGPASSQLPYCHRMDTAHSSSACVQKRQDWRNSYTLRER
jgi:hypothetical protein